MRIEYDGNRIDIDVVERVPLHLPAAGDLALHIELSVGGFAGLGSCWVHRDDFRNFATRTNGLITGTIDAPELQSMSPGDFRMRVSRANSRGHYRIDITVARAINPASVTASFTVATSALGQFSDWLTKESKL